ncbi:MAG: ABC transporter ATP-binding protein [Gammaproteobacteria bacterium]
MALTPARVAVGRVVLRAEDLTIGYVQRRRPPLVVAEGISVALQRGELVCLLGPNGAGKSTLIRTLSGMQRPLAGWVRLHGTPVHDLSPRALARRLSVVLTERVEVGALAAEDLVALGRYPYTDWSGRLTERDEHIVGLAMETVGASPLAKRKVNELSDGERQKVMIARALAQEPTVMILDEPTAFLDLPRRVDIMGTLRRLARQTGQAILLSTHDLDLALRNADTLWLLPQGGTLQAGAPEDLVLNGAFQAAFAMDGIEFDTYSGSFRLPGRRCGEVALYGNGVQALWTARALEREGFSARSDGVGSALSVEVLSHDGHTQWRVHRGQARQTCRSIAEVIACLRGGDERLEHRRFVSDDG